MERRSMVMGAVVSGATALVAVVGLAFTSGALTAVLPGVQPVAWTDGDVVTDPYAHGPGDGDGDGDGDEGYPGTVGSSPLDDKYYASDLDDQSMVSPPQIVKGGNPPSVTLVPPGLGGGVDRGIADTGVHSDGTWRECTCNLKRYHPSTQVPLAADTKVSRRITLSWTHNGDPATIRYRVGYQAQTLVRSTTQSASWTMSPITWTNLAPPAAEGPMTFTVRRTTPGVAYTLWLEVDVTTPETPGRPKRMQVAQLNGVVST